MEKYRNITERVQEHLEGLSDEERDIFWFGYWDGFSAVFPEFCKISEELTRMKESKDWNKQFLIGDEVVNEISGNKGYVFVVMKDELFVFVTDETGRVKPASWKKTTTVRTGERKKDVNGWISELAKKGIDTQE